MFALNRKEMAFKLFALAFACSGFGSILMGLQTSVTLWISIVLSNILLVSGYLLLFSGIISIYKENELPFT